MKNIFIYHIPKKENEKGMKGIGLPLKVGEKMKLYFFQEYYNFIRISFEEKFDEDENHAYSGLIKFVASSEFSIQLWDRERENQ